MVPTDDILHISYITNSDYNNYISTKDTAYNNRTEYLRFYKTGGIGADLLNIWNIINTNTITFHDLGEGTINNVNMINLKQQNSSINFANNVQLSYNKYGNNRLLLENTTNSLICRGYINYDTENLIQKSPHGGNCLYRFMESSDLSRSYVMVNGVYGNVGMLFKIDKVVLNKVNNPGFYFVSENVFKAALSDPLNYSWFFTNRQYMTDIYADNYWARGYWVRFRSELTNVGTALKTDTNYGSYAPETDNQLILGESSYRWKQLFSVSSSISTSDSNEKRDIKSLDDNLTINFINLLHPVEFVRINNEGGSRPHHGLIAQEMELVLQNLGIDHAAFIKSPCKVVREKWVYKPPQKPNEDSGQSPKWKEYNTEDIGIDFNYGLRYEELIPDIIKFIQVLYEKVEDLESRL